MNIENTLTALNLIPTDLKIVKELVYDKCGFDFTNLKLNIESEEYRACTFELNGKKIVQRSSKITPTKTGQFVTIWKRDIDGITQPFDYLDNFDFIIILAKKEEDLGQFIFPKSVLVEKGIITFNGKAGKRGIRVYPPWDSATTKQAVQTQNWQAKYFMIIKKDHQTDLNLTKSLLSLTTEKY